MKILHICTGFSIFFQGGITNYVRSLAEEQVQKGNKVFVLCDKSNSNPSGSSYHFLTKEISPKNSNRSYWKNIDGKCFEEVKCFLQENNFDLIHVHMVLNLPPEIIRLIEDYKYVVSLHDYFYLCPRIQMLYRGTRCEAARSQCRRCFSCLDTNFFGQRIYHRIINPIFRHQELFPCPAVIERWRKIYYPFLRKAQVLLPVSSRVEEIYQNSGIINSYKVLHIGNISAEQFDPAYKYEHSSYLNLVILSSVSYAKGGSLICKIIDEVNNPLLKFHFFGRSTKKESKMLERSKVINHGPYLQKDLAQILKTMDMGIVSPIWEDNGPQVVMEMLNNHLPVFATKMGGITDFVDFENGFLFDPFSGEGKNAAIEFLNNLSFEKIAVLKQNIKATISPKEHFEDIMKVYDSVIDE